MSRVCKHLRFLDQYHYPIIYWGWFLLRTNWLWVFARRVYVVWSEPIYLGTYQDDAHFSFQ